jgi:two-component system, LuxR family, response regulator FixJ
MKSSDHQPHGQPADPLPVTVYVVDDDLSHLRSISRLLRASGFHVVIHNSAAELLAELPPQASGCIVTDLMMPEMNGIELQEALRHDGNGIPIVFLTGRGDIPTSVLAMRSGAEDFLTKTAPKEDLLAAVRRALAHNEENRVRRARELSLREPFDSLTDREREVLRLVVEGMLNKQIAADLGIHERTVKLHRTNLTTKLRVHSVAGLTHMVDELRSAGQEL